MFAGATAGPRGWYASCMMTITTIPLALALSAAGTPAPPDFTVTGDNTVVTSSCRLVIAPGTVIADADGNGVVQVKGDNIVVEFAEGSVLAGAAANTPASEYTGTGIVVEGGRRVTIKGATVRGYKIGLHAAKTNSLTIDGGDYSGNFRQRLGSTPQAEDSGDWLYPHKNDNNEWTTNYGAAIWVEDSQLATIRNVLIRRGQNGIVLDGVTDSKIYDNDCSFLSGWGLALWRSSKNIISRNALDFCVRGHVEGVYNRGQDSAGLLMFEQCSNNTIVENSITHGGDGVFAFAGAEAIGDGPGPERFNYTRKGCNDNLFLRNDLSYAAAHGLELTFSHGNRIVGNTFTENAICGIWGGYSQDTIITGNSFTGNGGMAYGLERGAINMEHASDNKIFENTFINNKVAVHLWWDNDSQLLEKPGVKRNYKGVSGNVIAENEVTIDDNHPFKNLPANAQLIAWQFRDVQPAAEAADKKSGRKPDGHFKNNQVSQNVVLNNSSVGVELVADEGIELKRTGPTPRFTVPKVEVLGEKQPVGARSALAGRDKIIMDEWGPWDHESPILRAAGARGASQMYEVLGASNRKLEVAVEPGSLRAQVDQAFGDRPARVTVTGGNSVQPYRLTVKAGDDFERSVSGMLVPARWSVTVFPWTEETDPRTNLEAWRKLAGESKARATVAGELSLKYGSGGPRQLDLGRAVQESEIGSDRFGTVATTRVNLPAGTWKFTTLSDDGVRVLVNGKPVIENWTWHAPARDSGEFVMEKDGPVEITVEHFEIDGYCVLELGLELAAAKTGQ